MSEYDASRAAYTGTAILTAHHWADPIKGLRELRRVARGPVVVPRRPPRGVLAPPGALPGAGCSPRDLVLLRARPELDIGYRLVVSPGR